ncbi:MAG: hypothetical protein IPM22_09075 [Betaproteobacteria bacterium]|nr:hypothetical protein [Betaproteobacteria bacterium]
MIRANGAARVLAGYAWDGCTPKVVVCDVVLGTPDGATHALTGKPKAYYASLLHDALYQFLDADLPMSRKDADQVFLELLTRESFAPRGVYYAAVRAFGGLSRLFTRWKRGYRGAAALPVAGPVVANGAVIAVRPDVLPPSPRAAVEWYLRAKDENRPWKMERAFAPDAVLEVVAAEGTIAFPPVTRGRDGIADVLVRRFAMPYENVRTFCLAGAPPDDAPELSCDWLVGMSEKETRRVRVGCGPLRHRRSEHCEGATRPPGTDHEFAPTVSIEPGLPRAGDGVAVAAAVSHGARRTRRSPACPRGALDPVRACLATPHFAGGAHAGVETEL